MRISRSAYYGVETLVYLATEGPCRLESLAQSIGRSVSYMEGLIADLRDAGLVRTRRGPGGGCYLARAADRITVAEVCRVFEGPAPSSGPGAAGATLWHTGVGSQWGTGVLWQALEGRILVFLDGVSLADILPVDDRAASTIGDGNGLPVGRDPGVRAWH